MKKLPFTWEFVKTNGSFLHRVINRNEYEILVSVKFNGWDLTDFKVDDLEDLLKEKLSVIMEDFKMC